MTDPNRTHLEFVIDMSGSMGAMGFDLERGYRALIADQRNTVRSAHGIDNLTVSLNTFSSHFDNVYREVEVGAASDLRVSPRGDSTLYDALMRSINELGATLNSRPDSDRPAQVIVAILSDGRDTASLDFDCAEVARTIARQQTVYNWAFFLVSPGDQEQAVQRGAVLNIPAARCIGFHYEKAVPAFATLSEQVRRLRSRTA